MNQCQCGCGEEVPEGKRFRPAHHLRKQYRDAHKPKVNHVVGRLERTITGEEMLMELGGAAATTEEAKTIESEETRIEAAAQLTLDYVASLDPTWADRIRIGRAEKQWSARQFLGAMIGWMLDRSYHLEAPAHVAFEPGSRRFGESICGECQKKFVANIPGQIYCSEDCGQKVYRRQIEKERADRKVADEARKNRGAHNRA